ncbi:MAG TPA: CDP-diacylglycerol--glycerol-3-phosphate 3-phosphatidyltransferase [Solirubrobacteraceae bacterium]|jgi:CDP-diacylglycerol---glycerol-3-phosphate 3-phosphatidyltransferase|nr:CDP-diacylglycerol--glycerol-3-phosphate 3-phosphatidyltransferase [Solirubrobacteraceae bacterium]
MSSIRSARFLAASTSLRILLTPVIMALLFADVDPGLTAALFAFAAATDWVDGYLARRWEVTTKLGSFLDTTADKLLVTGVLIALVAVERASPWVSLIIIGRELMVLGLRGVIAAEGTVMQPSIWGRMKTAVQFLAILLAILRPGDEIGGAYVDEWVMLAAAAITVGSAIDYFSAYADSLRER